MSKLTKTLLAVVGISLALNLVWENLQAPLYQGYGSFWQHLPICSVASFGDALIILVLYFVLTTIKRDVYWIAKMSKTDVVILIILGALVAMGIEKWALVTERWQYTSNMLLLPFGIGLLPVLQTSLLPILIFYLSSKIYENNNI